MRRTFATPVLLIAVLLIAGCGQQAAWKGAAYDPPQPAPEIAGTAGDETPFRLSDLKGKAALVFFGYTFCPDVCPTTLSEFRALKQALGNQADQVEVVFVSVDPERDTPQRLAEYLTAFDPDFNGVHIEPDALAQILKAYGAVAEKRPYGDSTDPNSYSMDHTARAYLVDPEGHLRLSYAYGTPVEDIHADILRLLKP
jgi:protein SCO1/2